MAPVRRPTAELAAYRENFAVPPEDEAHRFVFHVRGDAGVGKTTLVREMENTAREHRALTAYVDESVNTVPDVMAAISAQFARQGYPLKSFDKLLATYRQRRHEADSAAGTGVSPEDAYGEALASASSAFVARAGLVVTWAISLKPRGPAAPGSPRFGHRSPTCGRRFRCRSRSAGRRSR